METQACFTADEGGDGGGLSEPFHSTVEAMNVSVEIFTKDLGFSVLTVYKRGLSIHVAYLGVPRSLLAMIM